MTSRAIDHGNDPIGPGRRLSIEDTFAFAEQQVRELVTDAPGRMPTYTDHGRWVFDDDPWAPSWNGGFLTGMMWAFARRTGKPWWHQQAEHYSLLLESRKDDPGTHDLGFVLEPSFGRWYDLDGNDHAREVIIQGARTMAGRLQAGGYLSTWVDPGSTFIDIMMNLGLLFRGADYSGDDTLRDVALTHCRTTRRYLMRGDGSTVHEGWFDTTTGEFLRADTHQGWRPDSTWARGQAWAIYGFADAYSHTGEPDLLDAARRAADYYISRAPDHGIPPNDFGHPEPELPWETSAAAIAAAGLLSLAAAMSQTDGAGRYRSYGLRILDTLRSTTFLAADTPGWQGILRHAIYHYRNQLGVDESVMWGDYYFVEALERATATDHGAAR
jgi:unsaturated chondroitin disaccharide hydrolase